MTWKEAIIKVLTDEGTPLHYSDITKRIIENGYRKPNEMGKTPEMTVSAQLTTKKNIFRKLNVRSRKEAVQKAYDFGILH